MYPAKIILFGEHTVLQGGQALAVPYLQFGVQWQKKSVTDERLLGLSAYLETHFSAEDFNFPSLNAHLRDGWQLVGNVPTGYGLGSSGTVCAAVYDRFAKAKQNLQDAQQFLAQMEGFYHGHSSGTDPLISLFQQPLLLGQGEVKAINLVSNWQDGLFLLDSGVPRQAAPLVDRFVYQYKTDMKWRHRIQEAWIPASHACLECLTKPLDGVFKNHFNLLSESQLQLAPWLIPTALQGIWQGKSYQLKLCGAGGGGFMLGYSHDWASTKRELEAYTIYKV